MYNGLGDWSAAPRIADKQDGVKGKWDFVQEMLFGDGKVCEMFFSCPLRPGLYL